MSERDPVISSSSFTFCSAHEEWAFLIPNSILRHFYFTILRDSFLIKEKKWKQRVLQLALIFKEICYQIHKGQYTQNAQTHCLNLQSSEGNICIRES